MATFKYNLQKPYETTPEGKRINKKPTRIYLFVIYDRANMGKIKTEWTIKPIDWNFKEKRIKTQSSGSATLNRSMSELMNSVEDEYNQIRKDHPEMKFPDIIQNIKTFVKTKNSPVYSEQEKSFFSVLDDFMEIRINDVSALTLKKYLSLKKSLKDFEPKLTFEKIDLKFFDSYIHYLRTKKPAGRQKTRAEGSQKGLLDDTVAKYIETLKNFLKWAYERDYHKNDIFKHSGFTIKRKVKHEIVTLFMDELQRFYKHDFSGNKKLEKVRDLFCFAAFTGQRWSDVEGFNKDDVSGDLWHFESYKTKKEIIVPLAGYCAPALHILEKYDYKLPKFSSQKFNLYLKEAGEAAGLNRPVKVKRFIGNKEIINSNPLYKFMTSHMARRTAVSLLLNVEGMEIHMVRELTGHSDLKTLDKYINKDSDSLRERLLKTQGIENMRIIKKDVI